MNIVIASIEEPIYIYRFWERVLQELHTNVRRIYIFKPLIKNKNKIIYDIFYKMLIVLHIYRPNEIFKIITDYIFSLTKIRKARYSLSALADCYNIPVDIINVINSEKLKMDLLRLEPDLVLAQIPVRVSKEILTIPKIGWINKHFGLLPNYKGAFPFLWAYWNKEQWMGVTIHFMNEQYDEGDILAQKRESLNKEDTLPSILRRLNEVAANLIIDCIKKMPPRQTQVIKENHFFKKPTMLKLMNQLIFEYIHRLKRVVNFAVRRHYI